uniref:Uncharacterized protein n=1 Tax=Ditylenchus dipsaci TaxID=166011 RepID=A0A915ETZ3_9BILA
MQVYQLHLPQASQLTKGRFAKPQTQQRKYKLRAGNTMTMEKAGSLAPELIVDVKQGLTSIFFPSAKRSESGNYQLNLKKEVGEDEGVFESVLHYSLKNCFFPTIYGGSDRSARPKGPLQVDNITEESCTLS